jgi:hypothetical protein
MVQQGRGDAMSVPDVVKRREAIRKYDIQWEAHKHVPSRTCVTPSDFGFFMTRADGRVTILWSVFSVKNFLRLITTAVEKSKYEF